MISEVLFLVSYGYGSGFGNLLSRLEQLGLFSYVLPFFLIFAMVFGIISKANIFDNKGINVIISLSVGLMALQFNIVSVFFADIFPSLGIGLVVLLALMILMGLFWKSDKEDNKKTFFWYMGLIIGAIVIFSSFENVAGYGLGPWFYNAKYWIEYNWGMILLVGVIIGAVMWITKTASSKPKKVH